MLDVLNKQQTSGLCQLDSFLRSADYSIKGGSQTWPTSGCLQEAKFRFEKAFQPAASSKPWILVAVNCHGQHSTSF